MAHAKQDSKRKRRRTALPIMGVAGVSLTMAGGASSAPAPTVDLPWQDTAPRPVIILGEEEISDVSLATFYVFDRENANLGEGMKLAQACGGCRGCAVRGCTGCRGCAARSCAARSCAARSGVARSCSRACGARSGCAPQSDTGCRGGCGVGWSGGGCGGGSAGCGGGCGAGCGGSSAGCGGSSAGGGGGCTGPCWRRTAEGWVFVCE